MSVQRINQQDIASFMEALAPIQRKLTKKYGYGSVKKAQQDRHDRMQAKKDAIFNQIDEAMNEQS